MYGQHDLYTAIVGKIMPKLVNNRGRCFYHTDHIAHMCNCLGYPSKGLAVLGYCTK